MVEEKIFSMGNIETWKDVRGYEGFYQVSNLGRIKVLSHFVHRGFCRCFCEEKILKPRKKENNYLFVRLSNGSKKTSKEYYVHRLVADAFLKKDTNRKFVDHINGDATDNRVVNLRWCTASENINNPNTKWKSKRLVPVDCFSLETGELLWSFRSLTEASKFTKVPIVAICCLIGNTKRKDNYDINKIGYIFKKRTYELS